MTLKKLLGFNTSGFVNRKKRKLVTSGNNSEWQLCISIHTYICIHTYIHIYLYIRVCVYSYISIYVCIYIPDFQVQHQQAAVCDVLEAPGQVTEGLEDLLSATFALANSVAVRRGQGHTWMEGWTGKTWIHRVESEHLHKK